MEILFSKIPQCGIEFETSNENIQFSGIATQEKRNLVKCDGILDGDTLHICDRCGEEFNLNINEKIEIYASNGIFKDENNLLNIIEFFNDKVNFDTILDSELNAIKIDYHYCDKCN